MLNVAPHVQASHEGTIANCACKERSALLLKQKIQQEPLLGELGSVKIMATSNERVGECLEVPC